MENKVEEHLGHNDQNVSVFNFLAPLFVISQVDAHGPFEFSHLQGRMLLNFPSLLIDQGNGVHNEQDLLVLTLFAAQCLHFLDHHDGDESLPTTCREDNNRVLLFAKLNEF